MTLSIGAYTHTHTRTHIHIHTNAHSHAHTHAPRACPQRASQKIQTIGGVLLMPSQNEAAKRPHI